MIFMMHGYERDKYRGLFDRLFKLRYDVFIGQRRWSLPSRGGLETDQYDTDEAVYFFDVGQNGEVLAHIRLTPTMQSSLLADYFPHLVETDENPRGPTVYESTRFMILPTQADKQESKRIKARFLAASAQWCIERGITHVQTVIDSGTLPFYVEISLLTRPMGLPHPFGGGKNVIGGGECLAFRWPINDRLMNDIRAFGELAESADQPWHPASAFAA